jgi:hypothetical protein
MILDSSAFKAVLIWEWVERYAVRGEGLALRPSASGSRSNALKIGARLSIRAVQAQDRL